MRKIVKCFIALAAFFAGSVTSDFFVSAQNLPEGIYLEPTDASGKSKGIAFRKSSELKEGTTDTYTVNLEAFVTGSVTMEMVSKPADIVLVLDVSGSMNETMYSYNYTARNTQGYSYYDLRNGGYYYKHTDGNYYEVKRSRSDWEQSGYNWVRYHRLYFSAEGVTYYLSGTGTTTTPPTNVTDDDDDIWRGVLYTRRQGASIGTKMENLKTAVGAFIDQIHINDLYEVYDKDHPENNVRRKGKSGADTTLGNQIAIVKFAEPTYYSNSSDWIAGSSTIPSITNIGNHFADFASSYGTYYYRNFNTTLSGNNRFNVTEVLRGFSSTSTNSSVESLKNAVNSLVPAGSTAADYGMNLARLLLESIKNTRTESSKTVVFFTDGSPTHYSDFDGNVANSAINYSYTIKNTYDAQVFSVGVFSDLGSNVQNVETYMNRISSNYSNASSMTDNVQPIQPPSARVYYQNASNADLTAVFQTIASASGGSGSTIAAGSVVTVDVVANSFSLPAGVTADDITVKVARCTSKVSKTYNGETKDYLTFDAPKDPSEYGFSITPTVGTNKAGMDTVSTTGFDFSTNWCGYDESPSDPNNPLSPAVGYRGYKQIISFDVKVKDDVVGGPAVATNDSHSGIFVNGEQMVEFNRPTVKIPISIWIKKKGLVDDASAVFNVQYAEYKEGVDPRDLPSSAWKSFTKVIVNANSPKDTDGYPVVKLVGLDPDFFYRIKEDGWAWTYDHDTKYHHTFGEDQKNPFVFENTPKPTVKQHEATVKNVFGDGYKVVTPQSTSSTGSGSGSGSGSE